MVKNYYAVFKGRKSGIYKSWEECNEQVDGYSDNDFKGFATKDEAEKWLEMKKNTKHLHIKNEINKEKEVKKVNLSPEQQEALKKLMEGENIFLTGGAGTGKSFLIEYFVSQLPEKNIITCAPTGIAALQIKGVTIHRLFNLKAEPIGPYKPINKIRDEIKEADIIIIDEISMCRFDIFDYVCRYIQKAQEISNRNKQLIVVGDFFQLAPICSKEERNVLSQLWGDFINESEGFAFETQMWDKMNFQNIILKEVMRQKGDEKFIENLNKIRVGDLNAIEWFNQNTAPNEQIGVYMYGNNISVKDKNRQKMSDLNQKIITYKGKCKDKVFDLPTDKNLELCVGARVMSLVNDSSGKYCNGSLGTVTKLNTNSVNVQFDNGIISNIEDYTWETYDYKIHIDEKTGRRKIEKSIVGRFTQIPLKVAFAITIHKSQGQTYDSANFNPQIFAKGQLYVALSRVTHASALYLEKKIDNNHLMVSDRVKKFYNI
jgi:ATP-dependent exoDNAse (exonuclease V) alpha subunit